MERLVRKIKKSCMKVVGEVDVAELLINEELDSELTKWESETLKIGVIGASGTGKSSFINAIRRLPDNREGSGEKEYPQAAYVGNTETTTEPKEYTHPDNEKFVLVDLPGVGTPNYGREYYLDKFDSCDCFIIITRDRFTRDDLWFAEEVRKRDKSFFFVRSKIDQDMSNLEDFSKEIKDKELKKIKNDILQHLPKESKIYLISSKKTKKSDFRDMYDFPKLREDMLNSLPDLKQEVLLRTLKAKTKVILEKKKNLLRKRLLWYSAASGAAGAVPVPGLDVSVDIGIFGAMTKEQITQLGISAADLEEAADYLEFSSREELLKYLAKGEPVADLLGIPNKEEFFKYLSSLGAIGASFVASEGVEATVKAVLFEMPGVGQAVGAVVGAGMSFGSTLLLGTFILNRHLDIATALLDLRLQRKKISFS